MGGKSKKKQTTTYTPPSWVEDNARTASQIGSRIARRGYQGYEGDRVAGLSENEQAGIDMAGDSVGIATADFDSAGRALASGMESWTDADQSRYINPYIKGALDPAAREIREEGQRGANALDARASSMDAFGGSRAALMRSENREKTLQSVSDLYGRGYAAAYESGMSLFGMERARDMEAAGRFMQLGGERQSAAVTDISTLMTTGATDRSIQQAIADFDFQQFMEERDWDWRQLGGILTALEGIKGSYTTTQTTETEQKANPVSQALGFIATITGAYLTGGASTAAAGATTGLAEGALSGALAGAAGGQS